MNKKLLAIIALSAVLRLVNLGSTPPGLYWDEVSLGYNSYSILKTGRDEHNEFLPYARFKAFGDYKPPGYIYATVPSIAIFGLNNFAVRLPSAVAGVFTVYFTYFLVRELFPRRKHLNLANLSALALAISPWHIQLSRIAFEANLAALLNLLAIYLFLKSRHKPWLLPWSAVSFVATAYTFNANRLLSPLLVVLLSTIYIKHLWSHKKQALVSLSLGILLLLPLLPHLRSAEGKLRWNEVNIFSNLEIIIQSNDRVVSDGSGKLAKLAHHRYLGHTINFLSHYFDHFDGRYLFLTGDANPRFSTQDVGELYLIELPLLLVGFYVLSKFKRRKSALLLLGWFLLAPIPSATARETPHALRTLSMLPTPQIIIALGILHLREIWKWSKRYFLVGLSLLYIISLTYFQIGYYHYYPQEYAGEWLTSYPRLINFLNQSSEVATAKKITVVPDLGRPYIYFLFYNQYSAKNFTNEVNRTGDAFGFFNVHGFGKYAFDRPEPRSILPGDIFITRANEVYEGFESLQIISETNGYEQFNVLKKL